MAIDVAPDGAAEVRAHEFPPGQGGMVPPPDVLPNVLPTDRLGPSAMPFAFLRDELRQTHSWRNVANVIGVWIQSVGVLWLACRLSNPLVWVAAFFLMGRAFALFAILAHEAAHKMLFRNKRANDIVGAWAVAYPGFVPLEAYRRSHFAHHKAEFGPNEPDLNLYNGYPISRASLQRKLWRDARGTSGWKNLKGLIFALRSKMARPVATKILLAQVGVFFVLVAIGGWDRWWLYPVFWLAPWMTVWRVINRLRAIAEHGGLTMSKDRRLTTHVVRQGWSPRFWMVPYNTGWHLAHHVDMGVPFQNLPALHDELVAGGWVTEGLEYPSYTALWKALSSAPAPVSPPPERG